MGKLVDAIRDRRKGRQRRMGFGEAVEEKRPSMLVGAFGYVEGADFCVALREADATALESARVDLWGERVIALTRKRVAGAKERGASFVAFELDGSQADAMLDDELDYVVRLRDRRMDEGEARALGSMRPAVIAVEVEFPLSLASTLELRRLAMLSMSPLGVLSPPDVSVGDIDALHEAGVAVLLLVEGAGEDDIVAVRQRVLDLPERKPRRDEGIQPLIPTTQQLQDDDEGEDYRLVGQSRNTLRLIGSSELRELPVAMRRK